MDRIILLFHLWRWFSFRHLRRHPRRTVAVLFGIALGAAVFTSVRLATDACVDSFSRSVDAISGKTDWAVVSPGGRVPEGLVAGLLRNPAVETASPLLTLYVRLAENPGDVLLLIGIDPVLDRPLRDWRRDMQPHTVASRAWLGLMTDPYSLLAGPALARRYHLSPGSTIEVEGLHATRPFRVIDTLSADGLGGMEGGQIAITDIASIQEFTGLIGQADRIDLLLRPSATPGDIEAIRESLPAGFFLERPSASRESGKLMIAAYQVNLSVLSFVSLFVGMFLVYSLISLHATARRHESAILRSIGASPRLIFLLFVSEGLFFGVIGWLAAIPLGFFMVEHLLGGISSTVSNLFVRVQVDRLTLDPWEVLLSFGITTAVSIIASLQPALSAMQVPPGEVMATHEPYSRRSGSPRKLAALGVLLIVISKPVSQLHTGWGIPVPGYFATFLLFAGFATLSPLFLKWIGPGLSSILRRFGGEPAFLACRTIRDSGMRIAISVGALITAIALFVSLAIMIHSFRNTVQLWVNQSIRGDLYIRPTMADINRYRDPLPAEITSTLRGLKDTADVIPYRRIFLADRGIPYQFEPIDFAVLFRHANFLWIDGRLDRILPRLLAGEGVVVSEVYANQTGLTPGKRFHAVMERVELDLPILGIFRDYRTQGGGVVHYSLARFQELTGDTTWSGASVFFKGSPQQREAEAARFRNEILVEATGRGYALQATLGDNLRGAILRIFDETFAVTSVLLLIALFVAALGVATTLTVLVLERASQIHTLLAAGASHGQIRSMIVWEAILMTFTGECIGLACGFSLSYLLIFVINLQSFGWTFIYSVDWLALALSLPLIFLTALVSAVPAGQIVFKQSPALILRER